MTFRLRIDNIEQNTTTHDIEILCETVGEVFVYMLFFVMTLIFLLELTLQSIGMVTHLIPDMLQ